MKIFFKSIFALVAGLFISNNATSKEVSINNRVLNIRKTLVDKKIDKSDSKVYSYYSSKVNQEELNSTEDSMKWHNNPNWNQWNWNNFCNQVNWRNWNKMTW